MNQQRQLQQPLFHPPATSKRTVKKASQQARDSFNATAEVALRALHADELDAIGTAFAAKLQKMSDNQRHIAERITSDVLYRGLINELPTYDAATPPIPPFATLTRPSSSTSSFPTTSAGSGDMDFYAYYRSHSTNNQQ
jgi:hypothetical protein